MKFVSNAQIIAKNARMKNTVTNVKKVILYMSNNVLTNVQAAILELMEYAKNVRHHAKNVKTHHKHAHLALMGFI